ncbi:MAG: ribosomal protein L16, partial [Planctomycetes bacterium]|nr:ribosomal protein L16 [Planctomycetota bacterium]
MALMPKRVKHRKSQRGRIKGSATRGNTVVFGDFGLQALQGGWIKAQTIEAGRIAAQQYVRGEGRRAVAFQNREEAYRVAWLASQYARTGEGRQADANRAATELAQREADLLAEEEALLVASANLCALLNLDPAVRLHATDACVVP